MARKYCMAIIGILLYVGILAVQETIGFSKSSRSPSAHRNHSRVEVIRVPQKLVLCSASALMEDQRTGKFLVQKKAEAVLPIASITKLMTAMVVLDAQMNLQESITINPQDVDTLRHSRSRLPLGTRMTRREATINSGRRTLEFHNSNRLIRNPRWQIGLSKTGFIEESGRCLVMQANVAQRPVLIVLLDSQGKLTRFDDANRIRKWIEEQMPAG